MDGHSKTLLPNPNFNCDICVVFTRVNQMHEQTTFEKLLSVEEQSHKGTHPRPGYRLCSINIYGCSCHVA